MARKPLRPLIRSGGFYPSRKWTPLVYAGGYTTANGGEEPAPPPIEKTITGNPIHILDALAKPAQALSVKLEPIQDLHGYDNPWPAGGGKNKLNPNTVTAGYIGSDGVIYPQSSNYYEYYSQDYIEIPTGSTSVSFGYNNYGSDIGNKWCTICLYDDSYGFIIRLYPVYDSASDGIGVYSTLNAYSTAKYIRISMRTFGHGLDGCYLAFGTDKTFAPYSNICPISGHTDADVTRTGKNLCENTLVGANILSDGTIAADTVYSVSIAQVKKGEKYIVRNSTNGADSLLAGFFTSAPIVGSQSYDQTRIVGLSNPFSSPIDGWIAFRTLKDFEEPQVSIGETLPAYSPYVGTTYPIPLGQTVYGGTLDVLTGVLTVDRAMVDMGTLDWTWYAQYKFYLANVLGRKPGAKNVISSAFKTKPGSWSGEDPTENIVWGNGSMVAIYVQTTTSYADADAFKTAMSGVQLCYELATPITIQLTPTQVELLLGENNIWSDGEMTLTYLADGNASDVEALNILLGNRYVNNHGEDEPTDREALDILLGR